MATTYGRTITWFYRDGSRISVNVTGASSPEEAFRMAFDLAKQDGWTAPRWWQWWRWHEVVRHDIKDDRTT